MLPAWVVEVVRRSGFMENSPAGPALSSEFGVGLTPAQRAYFLIRQKSGCSMARKGINSKRPTIILTMKIALVGQER
jgi:hypothetical protein